jgi:hypothetical protein
MTTEVDKQEQEIIPLNDTIYAGLSVTELEERLEMAPLLYHLCQGGHACNSYCSGAWNCECQCGTFA